MWEGAGDETERQRIDPHSIGHNSVFFLFSWAAKPGAWGLSLYGCWFSLPHLIYNSSDLQVTDFLSSPGLYNNLTSTLLAGVTNHTHSTRSRSRLYSDIPRPDAPVIYTGAFPILTARSGRRSVYNTFVGSGGRLPGSAYCNLQKQSCWVFLVCFK